MKNVEKGGPCPARDSFMKKQRSNHVREQINKTTGLPHDELECNMFNSVRSTANSVPPQRYGSTGRGDSLAKNGHANTKGKQPTDLNLTITECGMTSLSNNVMASTF